MRGPSARERGSLVPRSLLSGRQSRKTVNGGCFDWFSRPNCCRIGVRYALSCHILSHVGAIGSVCVRGELHRRFVTETNESQAIALVSLPEIAEAFENAGYRVVTDTTIQTALKAVTAEVKAGPVPVLVTNVGPASLLRTGTRRAITGNDGAAPVAVVVLDGGYTDFMPDRARVINTPCSFNELLDALDLPHDSSFDTLGVSSDGSVVSVDPGSQSTNDTTYDNSDATVPGADVMPGESSEAESFSEPVAVPIVPEVPAAPEPERAAQSHGEFVAPASQVPQVPDVPQVPSVPTVDVAVPAAVSAPVVPDEAEDEAEETGPVIPADVIARGKSQPGEWILQYDASGEQTTESAVGAWYSNLDGEIVPEFYEPNPRYVPVERRVRASDPVIPQVPEVPAFEPLEGETVKPVCADEPAVDLEEEEDVDLLTSGGESVSEDMRHEIDHDVATTTETTFVPADLDEPAAPPALPEPVAPVLPEPVVPTYEAPVAPPVAPQVPLVADVEPARPQYTTPEPVSPVPPIPTSVPTPEPQAFTRPVEEQRFVTATPTIESSAVERDDAYLDVRKRPHGKGDVVIVWGAKGGVGKTTTALNLAQRAAASGLRVVLIDGNFGQGDIRQYLRLAKANIPSIYDAAISRELKDAFVGPDTINYYRPEGLDDIKFVYVAAPPEHLADISIVTPELYAAIIAESTHFADLVVVDTQIVETIDTSGMVTRLIEPLLQENAWGVGVSDLSAPGMANLFKRLERFEGEGVPSTRMLTLLNKVSRTAKFNETTLGKTLSKNSKFLGTVYHDDEIHNNMNLGRTAVEVLALFPMLDTILATITGQQPPTVNLSSPTPAKKRKRGLFGRKASK
ncbi:AAA family ATPase [Aeromicrobium sp. 179-A 4D2 NHS]|uniref:nucleotide-binding protein n=1 Tax=Aeromicrobium sp. 179-A 4D2 NHS TaxID=3142375 RepID=UPI0039A204A4